MPELAIEGGGVCSASGSDRLAALERENGELRRRLEETEDVLDAIRHRAVDAFLVSDPSGDRVYALEGADRPYRRFVERMQEGALTLAADGLVLYCNRCAAALLQRAPERLIGQRISTCAFTDPAALQGLLIEGLRGTARAELQVRRDDGTELPLQFTASPLDVDGLQQLCLIVTDLTTQRLYERLLQSEDQRSRNEDRYRALAANLPGGAAFIVDCDLRYQLAAGEALRSICLTPDVLEGKTIFEVLPSALAREHEGDYRRVLAGYPIEREQESLGRYYLTRGVPLRGSTGQVDSALVVSYDITARKKAEDALREADRQKDEFLAMLAHELRNPLAPIRTAVEILGIVNRPGNPSIESARQIINRQVSHLVRLVDDLLDVARVSRGKIQLQTQTLDLATVVVHAVETCRSLIDARRQRLRVEMPETALRVSGDFIRLAQVVGNLLNNAAKYTDDGGNIDVILERPSEADLEATIRIRDNGRGIGPEALPHLFELFYQVDRTLDRAQGGLGIGLSLAWKLVDLHGGRLEAHSDGRGRGAEFIVRLPLGREDGREEPVREPGMPSDEPARFVLVVDDNRDAADTLAAMLAFEGHRVLTAYGGRSAIELALRERPDVVLLDLGLPEVDGYAACRAMRAGGLSDALIVAVTGYGNDEDRRRAMESGFDDHRVKPIELQTLRALLMERKKPATATY